MHFVKEEYWSNAPYIILVTAHMKAFSSQLVRLPLLLLALVRGKGLWFLCSEADPNFKVGYAHRKIFAIDNLTFDRT